MERARLLCRGVVLRKLAWTNSLRFNFTGCKASNYESDRFNIFIMELAAKALSEQMASLWLEGPCFTDTNSVSEEAGRVPTNRK